jgi:hypothetical protein
MWSIRIAEFASERRRPFLFGFRFIENHSEKTFHSKGFLFLPLPHIREQKYSFGREKNETLVQKR